MTNRDWFVNWIDPISEAINCRDADLARQAVASARDAVASGDIDPDNSHAMELVINYMECQRCYVFESREAWIRQFNAALQGFLRPTAGPVSDLINRRFHLQLRILGHNADLMQLTDEEFEGYLDRLPPEHRNTEQWYFITNYCFQHRKQKCIRRAYEEYLLVHSTWQEDYLWRRIETMHKAFTGRVVKLDVEQLLDKLELPGFVAEMRHVIWPVLEECGVVDEELREKLEIRLSKLTGLHANSN
jgi:hypothetical protein